MFGKQMRGVTAEWDLRIPVRDGCVLKADLYRPTGVGRYPVLMMRTPYGRRTAQNYWFAHPTYYAGRGYAVLVQDCRGRGDSGGEFEPIVNETSDTLDTLEWIAHQPWNGGSVGTYGFSYPGMAQLAAAAANPPSLRAMAPALTPSEMREGWLFSGGAFALGFALGWSLELATDLARRRGRGEAELLAAARSPYEHFWFRPLRRQPLLRRSGYAPFYFEWLERETDRDYWAARSLEPLYPRIATPALHVGGWYDVFADGTIRNFCKVSSGRGQGTQRLVIGPWHHIPGLLGPGELTPRVNPKQIDQWQLAWFDRWLREEGPDDGAPVQVYCIGAERWLHFETWPPPGVTEVRLYLRSQGRANSVYGDGRLGIEEPGEEPADCFVYDPAFPVFSVGGQSCCWPGIAAMGARDQAPVEASNNVLVYSTPPLDMDVLVAGEIRVDLYAVTSACDTDWVVRLCDVDEDGLSVNVKEGIIRARFRNGIQPQLLQPGEAEKYTVRVGNTCRLFRKGHRIRLQVTSSSFPTWEPNPNTGHPLGIDRISERVVATQVILHERSAPSAVVLPVIAGVEGLV